MRGDGVKKMLKPELLIVLFSFPPPHIFFFKFQLEKRGPEVAASTNKQQPFFFFFSLFFFFLKIWISARHPQKALHYTILFAPQHGFLIIK